MQIFQLLLRKQNYYYFASNRNGVDYPQSTPHNEFSSFVVRRNRMWVYLENNGRSALLYYRSLSAGRMVPASCSMNLRCHQMSSPDSLKPRSPGLPALCSRRFPPRSQLLRGNVKRRTKKANPCVHPHLLPLPLLCIANEVKQSPRPHSSSPPIKTVIYRSTVVYSQKKTGVAESTTPVENQTCMKAILLPLFDPSSTWWSQISVFR